MLFQVNAGIVEEMLQVSLELTCCLLLLGMTGVFWFMLFNLARWRGQTRIKVGQ